MLSTSILLVVLLGTLLAGILLWMWLLRFGLKWAKISDVTTKRIGVTTLIVAVLQLAVTVYFGLANANSDSGFLILMELGFALLIPWATICTIFSTNLFRAVQAWLPTLLSGVVAYAIVLFVINPFILQSFQMGGSGMAPVFLGEHFRGTCSECGKVNYCSPVDNAIQILGEVPIPMICSDFHVTEQLEIRSMVYPSDRFLVAKYLKPRRWDVVAFDAPSVPGEMHSKRLVGLPGETIVIKSGAVWIDGKELSPPEVIRGIEYLSSFPDWPEKKFWGSEERPVKLGSNEYFVLGDFSVRSLDSRNWTARHGEQKERFSAAERFANQGCRDAYILAIGAMENPSLGSYVPRATTSCRVVRFSDCR